MDAERTEPLLMTAWWREFARTLYSDELGDAFRGAWGQRASFIHNVLSGQPHWCDDVRTAALESCDAVLADRPRGGGPGSVKPPKSTAPRAARKKKAAPAPETTGETA